MDKCRLHLSERFFREKEKALTSTPRIMKKNAYLFLAGFGVWCVISALWYLFGVKGVVSHANQFDAPNRFVAIAEILFMLLGACLFGFAIAWFLRKEEIVDIEISNDQLYSENERLCISASDQAELYQKQVSETATLKLKIAQLIHEKEEVLRKGEQEAIAYQKLKVEAGERKWQLEQMNGEIEKLQSQINEWELKHKILSQANIDLKEEIKQLHLTKDVKNTPLVPAFVKQPHPTHKDDLTKIKGVGPFIEKRLNMLGIYTFQQLSELNDEMIDHIGTAIEFFPGRILRENWIGQAAEFNRKNQSV
jgi:predicted flap endonuclease-1-like 5' DNA nuclease